jgi:ribose/xylose/arabinose/galactoside ABC-type transport system permease subunit
MPERRSLQSKTLSRNRIFLPCLALIVMVAVMGVMQPRSITYAGLQLILRFALPMLFAAMAQLCVIAASDIDLGIGPFISLVNCIVATVFDRQPALCLLILIACVLAYAGMGAFIQVRRVPSIIVTLGASFVWLGLALLIVPTPGGASPEWLGAITHFRPFLVPLPILVAIMLAIFGHWLFRRSSYGVVMRGLGSAPEFVRDAGWSLTWTRSLLYGLAGIFGTTAGLALTGLINSGDPNVGTPYT